MPTSSPIDFDEKDGLKLFQAVWQQADEMQDVRDVQYEADYQNFHAFVDMANRNPDRANIAVPKIRSIIQTKLPRDVRAAIGRRPFIPFTTDRDEYREQTELQERMLDQVLGKAGFGHKFILMDIINILYGTAFMEAIPTFVPDFQKLIKPAFIMTPQGLQVLPFNPDRDIERVPVKRFRLKLTTYAPWEIRVDPFATSLDQPEDCRYIVKIKITSKRAILMNAEKGAYGPDFDFQRFKAASGYGTQSIAGGENRGFRMLNSLGLPTPAPDEDIGVLFRVEMPEATGGRYIDIWNDQYVLFDRPNPFSKAKGGHGLINLSRAIHNIDPHTAASFWGNGEGKVNEIMQSALSDSLSLTLDNANFLNSGKTYYAKNRGVSADMLINEIGNKIGFNIEPNEDIRKLVMEDRGMELPSTHFALQRLFTDYMDLTSNSFPVSRGQQEEGEATLGEVSLLKESGDELQELNVKLLEEVFLSDFGTKCLGHLEQFARHEDKEELLGVEDAQKLIFMNPQDLPGGFNYAFEGSDRVLSQAIRQNNLIKLDQRISESPILNERGWLTILMKSHDLGDDIDDALIPVEDEIAQLMVQQEEFARREQIADKSGPQTTGKKAQEAGRVKVA